MKVKELKTEGLEKEFEMVIPSIELDNAVESKLQELVHKVSLPGFRPGKVPMSMIKKKYSESVFFEVAEEKLKSSINNFVKENKFNLIRYPDVSEFNAKPGQDVKVKLTLELRPEFELPKFSDMNLKKVSVTPSKKDVDETKAFVQESYADRVVVEDKKTVTASGDMVKINFKGFKDGEAFQGGESKNFPLKLGSNSMIPGFEDQIIGKKLGEEFDIEVTFPKEYHSKDLAGAKAKFEIKINEIVKLKNHDWNEELAKKMNHKNLEELDDFVSKTAGKKYYESINLVTKIRLFNAIDSATDFELPSKLVENEYNNLLAQLQESDEKPQDDEKENYRKIARRRVKIGMVLSEYANAKNISVTDKDLQNIIMFQAREMNLDDAGLKSLVGYYSKNKEALASMRDSLLEAKAVEHIIDNEIKWDEEKITPAKLDKLIDEEADNAL